MGKNTSDSGSNESAVCKLDARSVFDSLSAHIAILDENGVIVDTNQAWRDFAVQNGKSSGYDSIGENYLRICELAEGEDAAVAKKIAAGIGQVTKGLRKEFVHDYPCHSPSARYWYYIRVIRMSGRRPVYVVVSHEDITNLKLTEEALRNSREALEETNIALKVLLKQREADKLELEKKVLANVKELVFPYLNKLKTAPLKAREKTIVDIIVDHLNDIISPLMQSLSHLNIFLTPQEMQIATLVKDGKSTQEISDLLHISEATVSFHRKNIRKKLGISNQNRNLRSYLMTLEK
ncbi:MAG: LuxR C-terminal-related transcriptional regulator [Desulfobacterales bacterium]|jgi:DNA-binding CsgD family transcriptional regulator/PAS domain-containing protein|nr:LuxR C-terminal-related transcriptional regulator [Desulfobacterales bacterium]